MRLVRSFSFAVLVPLSVLILVQGCSGGSTGGSCVVTVDDASSSGAGQCGNGPKQGAACCVSASAACAPQLPLCGDLCCVVASSSEGGREGGTVVIVESDGAVTDAKPVRPDAASSGTCTGNTKQQGPFLNSACQSALEQNCCTELKSCFNIVPSGTSTDCNGYSDCISQCGSAADIATCQTACDDATTTSVKSAYEAIVSCAMNNASTNAACQ